MLLLCDLTPLSITTTNAAGFQLQKAVWLQRDLFKSSFHAQQQVSAKPLLV
jgi:hypothetical protein